MNFFECGQFWMQAGWQAGKLAFPSPAMTPWLHALRSEVREVSILLLVFINPFELGDNKHICSFFRSAFQSLGGNGSGEPEPRNGLSTIVHGIAQLVYFIRTARISFRPGCPQDLQRKTILHIIRFNCIVRRACGTCPQVLSNFKKQWWEDWICGMCLTTIRWIWILKLIGRWTVLTPVCLRARARARASGYCMAPGLEPRLMKTRAEGQLWYDKPRHLIVQKSTYYG